MTQQLIDTVGASDSIQSGGQKINANFTELYGRVSVTETTVQVQSVAGKTGIVSLISSDVGLGNVDNTSDTNKPISTATQTSMNGKANLISGEVSELPAGAAGQVAAGRGVSTKRADGSWSKKAVSLPQDYALQTWSDALVSGVVYNLNISTPQNGLPASWWYIEVLRHWNDNPINHYRTIRATRMFQSADVYISQEAGGVWTPFYQMAMDTPLTWVTPTLVSGWANYFGTTMYAKDSDGNVHVNIDVNGGSNMADTIIFNLPLNQKFAPSVSFNVVAITRGGVGNIYVSGNQVRFAGAGSGPHTGNATTGLFANFMFKGEV